VFVFLGFEVLGVWLVSALLRLLWLRCVTICTCGDVIFGSGHHRLQNQNDEIAIKRLEVRIQSQYIGAFNLANALRRSIRWISKSAWFPIELDQQAAALNLSLYRLSNGWLNDEATIKNIEVEGKKPLKIKL